MKLQTSLPPAVYTREYYLSKCGGYEEYSRGEVSSRLVQAFQYGEVVAGMRVLDIGCGRGELALQCAEAGCEVWAVDYSPHAVRLVEDRLRTSAPPALARSIRLQHMNAMSLGLASRSFDRAFMIDVVEHLHPLELARALAEVRRVMKPGGMLIVHTAPNAWLIHPIYFIAGLLLRWRRHPYHVNEQSVFSLRRNLASVGSHVRVWVTKVPGFFRLGVGPEKGRCLVPGTLATVADMLFDTRVITLLIAHTPLTGCGRIRFEGAFG